MAEQPPRVIRCLAAGWVAIAAGLSLLSVWAHLRIGLNNDHLALVDQTRKLLAGATPYVDYTDVSPPLIHLLYIVPVLLAKLTGAPVYVTLYACVYLATAASLALVALVLLKSGMPRLRVLVSVSTLALALLGCSFIHQVFADRDHLVLVLCMPWCALYAPDVQRDSVPMRLRMAIAAMAGVGFAIKPFFYIFYAATTAFALSHTRWQALLRQREQHVVWGIGAAYLALVLVYFRQYLFTILPVGLETYDAIAWGWGSKLDVITHELLGKYAAPALTAMLALLCVRPRAFDRTLAYLYVMLLAGLASYALNFGWYYTQYPFIAFALVLAVAVTAKLLAALDALQAQAARWTSLLLACAGVAAQLFYFFWIPIAQRAEGDMWSQRVRGHTLSTMDIHPEARQRLERQLDAHPRYIFFNMDLWAVNLLKEGTPRESVGRFDYMWPMPGLVELRDQPQRKETYESIRSWLTDSVADDIERHQPDLIINDVSATKRNLPAWYNMMDMLNTNPRFTAAMGHYTLADKMNYCSQYVSMLCAFDVYVRK